MKDAANSPVEIRRVGDLPARAGISFKPEHFDALVSVVPDIGFIEVHAENYLGAGGPPHAQLTRLRENHPLSIHGVSLSIGGALPPDGAHLARLKQLLDRYQPESFSEHLAWSTHGDLYLNDLLPVAYDAATLHRVCAHVDQVQTQLQRRMLLENPSTYVELAASTWQEIDFLAEIVRRTGCGLLLDINNVQVSCVNHQRDASVYLNAFPLAQVGEIHLAGYAEDRDSLGGRLLIDAHDRPVQSDVWALYQQALTLCGPRPTLIEWDNDVPPPEALLREAAQAQALLTAAARQKAA